MWIFLGFRFQKLINQQFSSFRQELLPAVNLAFDHSPQVILFSYMFAQSSFPIIFYSEFDLFGICDTFLQHELKMIIVTFPLLLILSLCASFTSSSSLGVD